MPIEVSVVPVKKLSQGDKSFVPRRNLPSYEKLEVASRMLSSQPIKEADEEKDDSRNPSEQPPAGAGSPTDPAKSPRAALNVNKNLLSHPVIDKESATPPSPTRRNSIFAFAAAVRPSIMSGGLLSMFKKSDSVHSSRGSDEEKEQEVHKFKTIEASADESQDSAAASMNKSNSNRSLHGVGASGHGLGASGHGLSNHSTNGSRMSPSGPSKRSIVTPKKNIIDGLDVDDTFITMPLIHEKSFISHRVNADTDTTGIEAIFSRSQVSVAMTRSLGDRDGPRTVCMTPEVSKISVPSTRTVRFVLGTNSLWRAVDNEQAGKLIKGAYSPGDACKRLINKATSRSVKRDHSAEDVTVIVVDISAAIPKDEAVTEPCTQS